MHQNFSKLALLAARFGALAMLRLLSLGNLLSFYYPLLKLLLSYEEYLKLDDYNPELFCCNHLLLSFIYLHFLVLR
jgi:hypothetical protein